VDLRADKERLRARLLAARAARPESDRQAAATGIAVHGLQLCAGLRTVAAYAGVGEEPPTRALVDGLRDAGCTVLMPVVAPGHVLEWVVYDGWDDLQAAGYGLLEPRGSRLGPAAVAGVDVVLAPALAVDRAGNRLGRGAGYYDRALAQVAVERVVAVVYADEVVDEVPAEPHDHRVGAALTPSGVVALG
jgi:5-formyltetrahydrofolate cyclo-ligase